MHANYVAGFFDTNDDNVSISKDDKYQRLNIAQPDLFIYKRRRQVGIHHITIASEIKAFCLRFKDHCIIKKRWLELMLEYVGIMRNYKSVPIYIRQQRPLIYMRMRELSLAEGRYI